MKCLSLFLIFFLFQEDKPIQVKSFPETLFDSAHVLPFFQMVSFHFFFHHEEKLRFLYALFLFCFCAPIEVACFIPRVSLRSNGLTNCWRR